ncbi:retrovirus-related pol polyprotein from transposon TNT 1-94 [Tanacetum coccineum]
MTTVGTRVVVVHTGKGKMDTDRKKSRWVWRPNGNYLDHASKDSGSFMLKKGNPKILLQDHAVVDSSCFSHMTGSKAYLSDYEDYNGGFVAFGSDPKGDELKFNLFSISQMCDKKNSVLFTKTECLILSPSFKLLDESQVVLRAPRKDDVYSLDLKNIVPSGGLENQLNHNVKIIRCDNETEFKNHAMNEFCAKKGIKREFSVARTPQQNGVAERKNRTLIEAARTMVLVTKPQNKTPYELLIGNSPSISFMRPFGCPLTILNTLDSLGKFDGKYDEGYLLGYSTTSKAFRVYNKRTKRVEENLHINFLEDQPNVAGTGPNWMTRIPVEDVAPATHENPSESSPKVNDVHDSEDVLWMMQQDKLLKKKRGILHLKRGQLRLPVLTNLVLLGKIPIDASTLLNADLPIDLNMPNLEDASDAFSNDGIFNGAYDDENVGAVADFNNMDDTINVSLIPTLRIHKDHPKDQILGDPKSAVQTRGKIQKDSSAQQALDERSIVVNHKVKLIAQGFRQEEGIDYDEVFAPVARIEAIMLFLAFASYMGFTVYQMDVKSAFLYGTIEEEVYVHQPLGFVDPAYPNKVYKRGTKDKTLFIKKKKSDIMLVQVYVDDIIFGSSKSLCTEFEDYMHKRFQMSSIGELTFFLGLQVKQQPDGIFISQDKYVADILKKFNFWSIRTASTPIKSNKPLIKDEDGEDVDVHVYRSMIGSLMYLTASRPDIMFAVCACARFQKINSNAVISSSKDDNWQCKKQTIVENSTIEAEYVAAANCCGQVLWIQNQMMDYGFNFMNTRIHIDNESTISVIKNPVAHSRTKHIEIRFHFIRDCYEKRLIEVIKIHTDSNVADLLTKGFDVIRFNFLVVSIGMLNL